MSRSRSAVKFLPPRTQSSDLIATLSCGQLRIGAHYRGRRPERVTPSECGRNDLRLRHLALGEETAPSSFKSS